MELQRRKGVRGWSHSRKKKYHPESVSISKRNESAESLLNSIDGPKTPIVFIRF